MNRINRQEPAESATPRPKQHQVHAEHEDEEIGQVFNSNRAEHDTMSETQTPPGTRMSAICLWHALCGTDAAYAATRS
eukprot:178411-Rhodomonas_salina.1